jgi:hypothetical protein
MDILFVIDGTESMTKYFAPVVDAVRQAMIDEKLAGIVRFAANVYGDYKDSSASLDKLNLDAVVPFGSMNDPSSLEPLLRLAQEAGSRRTSVYRDGFKDLPEAAFAALLRSVNEAEWSNSAAMRVVVWIADHGNRRPNENPSERVSIDDVAKALRKSDAAFIPINVRGAYSAEHNGRFLEQAQQIAELASVPHFPPYPTYKLGGADDSANTVSVLREFLGYVFQTSSEIPRYIATAERDGVSLPDRPVPDRGVPFAVASFRDQWLDYYRRAKDADLNTYNLSQAVTDGYVYHRNGSRDLSFWVAVEPREFDALKFASQSLCKALERTDIGPVLEAMFLQLTTVMSGDPYGRDEAIAVFLERVLNIPKSFFASLLDKTLVEIEDWWRDQDVERAKKDEFYRGVCRSAWMLNRVEEGERVALDDIEFDPQSNAWHFREGRNADKFNWVWAHQSGVRLMFLPVTYLPQDRPD